MDGTGGAVAQAGGLFAYLGADVIKVENGTYPVGARIVGGGTMNASFVASQGFLTGLNDIRLAGAVLSFLGAAVTSWLLPGHPGQPL